MKDLTAQRGRHYINRLIAEGEHECQDFKYAISDARKIARSISAFANHNGGRLLIGVKDNGHVAGVRNEEDIYVVEQAAGMYCRPEQHVEFTAYSVDAGVTVISAVIAPCADRPVQACEPDGTWKAYYRVADENIAAHPLMVRAWKRRSDTSRPLLFTMTERDSALLSMLDDTAHKEGLTELDVALALHVSMRQAENLIVRLAALGIVDFRYNGHRFMVVRASD